MTDGYDAQHQPPKFVVIAAVNSDEVFSANLVRSPEVVKGVARVIEQRGHSSAGAAYNSGIDQCDRAPVIAFVHQDVYLPAGWVTRVSGELGKLADDWAVAGVWGICPDRQFAGRVWCTGGGQEHRGLAGGPHEAASVDEIVIVLNMRHGLRFDEDLPGFHLYATDIIQQARARGLKSYVVQAPVIHNSRWNPRPLDRHFFRAYRYMQRKWRGQLPLLTCTVPVSRTGWQFYRQWARNVKRSWIERPPATDRPDARQLAVRLGYEPAGVEVSR